MHNTDSPTPASMRLNVVALLGSLAVAEAYFKPVAPKVQAPKLFSLAARAPKLR